MGKPGHPRAGNHLTPLGQGYRADRLTEALGDGTGNKKRRLRQYDREFVVAAPGNEIDSSNPRDHRTSNLTEDLVPLKSPQGAIDRREVVEVKENKRKTATVTLRPRQFVPEALYEVVAREDRGQSIQAPRIDDFGGIPPPSQDAPQTKKRLRAVEWPK